jgi:hypothetical protein
MRAAKIRRFSIPVPCQQAEVPSSAREFAPLTADPL